MIAPKRLGAAAAQPRRARCHQNSTTQAGYAAIDALVALTILASTIVFAVAALQVADKGAAAALEARQAREVMSAALDQAPAAAGQSAGAGPGFTWQLVVGQPQLVAGGMTMCEQDITAKAQPSGRIYRLSSARICAAAAS